MLSNPVQHHFFAHGKLLLSGEYLVLDGAKALAVPTQKGQHLRVGVNPGSPRKLFWKSYNADGSLWFEATFDKNLHLLHSSNAEVAERLQNLLLLCVQQNPEFYSDAAYYEAETQLEFDRNWGLGSSSTLIHLLAQWAGVNPYQLLWNSFGGSAYDIACADAKGAIVYQLIEKEAKIKSVDFSPPFLADLYLIYLGKKQNSAKEIGKYKELIFNREEAVKRINLITEAMHQSKTMAEFEKCVIEHESILSEALGVPTLKEQLFANHTGFIKSLGAWGGDFVLSNLAPKEGYEVYRFKELVLV